MRQKNAVTKRFCSDKIRFADLINGVYFQGRMETLKQNVESLMGSLSISLEKACELLGRSEDYEVLHQMLQK